MGIDQNERVRLLAKLCRELTELGLRVGMSDAKPALSVHLGPAPPCLWISFDTTGDFFEWCHDGTGVRHTVTDPRGTARRIADRVEAAPAPRPDAAGDA